MNLLFLGHALTLMLVYVWSRRTPFVRMNFFGLLNFNVRSKLLLLINKHEKNKKIEFSLNKNFFPGTFVTLGTFGIFSSSW